MLILHCLNLKITYNCTNNCSFCFSSYLKDNVISLEGLKSAVKKGFDNGCDELVISGGEPTSVPKTIMEIVSLAQNLGYKKYIIQTNGSGLSEDLELLDFLNEISNQNEFCISFSIHGSTAEIHDKMSRTQGAYNKLIKAMQNVSKTNCRIYTNTVVSALNIKNLKEIANLLLSYNPEIMQFSMMHLSSPSELSVNLFESVSAIRELKTVVSDKILKTEGIPYCLLYGMEKCVGESCWPNTLDLYNKEDNYMKDFKQLEHNMRSKLDICPSCIMDSICMGVWSEHLTEFSNSNIKAIR